MQMAAAAPLPRIKRWFTCVLLFHAYACNCIRQQHHRIARHNLQPICGLLVGQHLYAFLGRNHSTYPHVILRAMDLVFVTRAMHSHSDHEPPNWSSHVEVHSFHTYAACMYVLESFTEHHVSSAQNSA